MFYYFAQALAVIYLPAFPLLMAVYVLPEMSAAENDDSMLTSAAIGAAIVLGLVGIIAIVNRLSLVLPAIALGHKEFGWSTAWHATRGNTWRI